MPNFNRGGDAASKAASKASFKRTNYFRLEDGESEVIRMIDDYDDWISIGMHVYVPTKGAPADVKDEAKEKWPKTWFAVCRAAKNNDGELVFPEYNGECFICDDMRDEKGRRYPVKERVFARAVRREKVVGLRTGYRDSMITVQEADGTETRQRDVLVLQFYWGYIFSPLRTAYENVGSLLDRDYKITRRGKGTDTDYDIWPLDPVQREDGSPFTLQDPSTRKKYTDLLDLGQVIAGLASDEHYARFFDPTKEIPASRQRAGDAEDTATQSEKAETTSASGTDEETNRRIQEIHDELMRTQSAPAPAVAD